MKTANRIIALLAVALGVYAAAGGVDLEILASNGQPSAGFFPACIGALIVLIGILIFIDTFHSKTDNRKQPFDRAGSYDTVVVTGASVAVMVLTPFLGMVISLGIMAGGLAALMGERRAPILAGLTLITPAFLYLVFGLGLGVPLPKGFLAI